MLVLSSESSCDICAEHYSQESLPHSIPCGHTFCAPCLHKVVKGGGGQWAPRNAPCGCPMCRESFNTSDIRRIRIDTAPSNSPPYPQVLPYPNYFPAPTNAAPGAGAGFGKAVIDEDALDTGTNEDDRIRIEAKRLEQRVADSARRRCTFDEISALHREVQQWLDKQVSRRPDREHPSLRLSAALLGAILVNGFAYNEAKKQAKGVEVELKDKLEHMESVKRRLELEVHRQRTVVYELKAEMSKLTGAAPPAPPPPPPTPAPTASGASTPSARSLGSSVSSHSSGSSSLAHRSQTPAPTPSTRSHTPAPTRSQTPGAALSSAYGGYSHHANSVSPTRPVPVTTATSRSPDRPGVPGQHQRWIPHTTREDEDRDTARPGTAFGNHARTFSLSAGAAATARPRTAAGWRS